MRDLIQFAKPCLILILAFVVFFAIQIASLALMWFSLGSRFAFSGDGPVASDGWCMGMLAGTTLGSFVAGLVLAVGGKPNGARLCLALALILCALNAYGAVTVGERLAANSRMDVDLESITFAEAGNFAVSPEWYYGLALFANGAAVVAGGRLVRNGSQRKDTSSTP